MPITNCTFQADPPSNYKAPVGLHKPYSKAASNTTVSKIEHVYTKAVDYLRVVIKAIDEGTLDDTQRGYATAFFLGGDLGPVRTQLDITLTGLTQTNITVHVGGVFPYVKRLNWPDWINIPLNILNNPVQSIRFFIHEATHLFADAKDFGIQGVKGYINDDGSFRQQGITQEEALINADSLACFVTRVNGDKLS